MSDSSAAAPLVVSVSGLEPGAPMRAAGALADALDARRVPLTLLAGAHPHPEVVTWVAARRRAGDAVLLHGTGRAEHHRSFRRTPGHEAGLRLAGALRARDTAGLEVDGFAAPGWTVSEGVRAALAAAGVDLLVDDTGVHRLTDGGAVGASVPGPLAVAGPPAPAPRRRPRILTGRLADRWAVRRVPGPLRHHGVDLAAADRGTGAVDVLLDAVDRAIAAGAVPDTAPGLLAPRRAVPAPRVRPRDLGDPELWSITS